MAFISKTDAEKVRTLAGKGSGVMFEIKTIFGHKVILVARFCNVGEMEVSSLLYCKFEVMSGFSDLFWLSVKVSITKHGVRVSNR